MVIGKTAAQQLYEDLPTWARTNHNGRIIEWQDLIYFKDREPFEQAAKKTYTDQRRIISPEERVKQAQYEILGHEYETEIESEVFPKLAKALDIMPKFPEGYLLPCPTCGAQIEIMSQNQTGSCGHFCLDWHERCGQTFINATNAALWSLGSRPNE